MQGIVERLQRDEELGFIRGDDGREFTFNPEAVDAPFESIKLGTKVEFDVTEPGYGDRPGDSPRAVAIHVSGGMEPLASGSQGPAASAKPDAEAVASQVPPKAVQDNEVDESSWESFPASDAPAKHETT